MTQEIIDTIMQKRIEWETERIKYDEIEPTGQYYHGKAQAADEILAIIEEYPT